MSYLKPRRPTDETRRLLALRDLRVLDTEPEVPLDDITFLASQICGTPIALISLVDEERQWFKSRVGLTATETPRDIAFCAHAINGSEPFVVPDATTDDRFRENPLVTGGPKVQFYAGAPLTTSSGHNIGTLCVIDQKPRIITPDQAKCLEALARQVIENFEHRKTKLDAVRRENFLSSIVQNLPDLIAYIDRDYRYRYVNKAYATWFKIDHESVAGRQVEEIIGAAPFAAVKNQIDRALAGEPTEFSASVPYVIQGQTITKAIHARYVPDRDEHGNVMGIYGLIADITRLKKAESDALEAGSELTVALAQATASERAFRAIFDNCPIGIIQLDGQSRFVASNPAFELFLGYTSQELKALTIFDVTHPEDRARARENLEVFSGDTGFPYRFKKRYVHKNGDTVVGLVTSRGVRLSENGEQFLFSVIEDYTKEQEREKELTEAQAQVFASAKLASLGQMAAGIAHEINNPLAIIKGRVDLLATHLKAGPVDLNKTQVNLETVSRTCDRIGKIVAGMKTFSRRSDGDPFQTTSVASIVDETLALCREKLTHSEIEVRVHVHSSLKIDCRPTEISQIVMNLINNAYDALTDTHEPWIAIDAAEKDGRIRIRVTDSGPGVPSAVVDRLMEPFFTTKDVGKGTGLGLSLSKGIAEAHHGHLRYDAKAAHTCFELELPVSSTARAAAQRSA